MCEISIFTSCKRIFLIDLIFQQKHSPKLPVQNNLPHQDNLVDQDKMLVDPDVTDKEIFQQR